MLPTLLLGSLLLATPAAAQEQPEFLLPDAGVRVELPEPWTRDPSWRDGVVWSDWDLQVTSKVSGVMLVAWQTYGQTPIREEELEDWVSVYQAKAAFMYLSDLAVEEQKVVDTAHGPMAWTRLTFTSEGIEEGLKGTWVIGTLTTGGQNFHISTITPLRPKKAIEELDGLVGLLEVVAPPEEVKWGPTRASSGVTLRLSEHWRLPLESEVKHLVKNQIQTLGMGLEEGLPECIKAIHPRPPIGVPSATKETKMFAYESDFLISCQGGMLLGIVDPYTFEDREAQVRSTIWGPSSEMAPATRLDLPDRTGFLYESDIGGGILLLLAVVPYDEGISRTYVLSRVDERERAIADLKGALESAAWSGKHPTSAGDWISYYPSYRPLHPFVLVPVLLVLGALGLGGFTMIRKGRKSYEDLD